MGATTVGAGLFGLPFVIMRAGWAIGIAYLASVSAVIIFAHTLYLKTLQAVGERKRLVGLTKELFGPVSGALAFVNVVGGLMLALVAYLVLAGQLVELLFPGMWLWGVIGFWFLASIPILFSLRRLAAAELVGGIMIAGVILIIFFSAWGVSVRAVPTANLTYTFLPFGIILFAL